MNSPMKVQDMNYVIPVVKWASARGSSRAAVQAQYILSRRHMALQCSVIEEEASDTQGEGG